MGSRVIEGVTFCIYSNDHPPRHVHAVLGRTRVVIELLPTGDVQIAKRKRAFTPPDAKKADLRKALALAAKHFAQLVELWENIHGKA